MRPMTHVSIVEDLQVAETLWRRHYPQRLLFDLWPVREAFQKEFNRPPCFLVATRGGRFCGMLALSWIEEALCFGHFPGEVWHQKTWLEQNRLIAADPDAAYALLERIPDGAVNIRYLVPEAWLPSSPVKEVDEVGYLFHPWRYDYSFPTYLQSFSGKSRKKMRRERERLQAGGIFIRHDHFGDIDHLFDLNLTGFGEISYFWDARFLRAFENLALWLNRNRMLRITTILVGGRVAAVDMSAVFNGTCTVLAGGTHSDFPGIAKVINFNHLEWACLERIREVDFLCGEFNWKHRFHLTPRPLFKIGREAASDSVQTDSLQRVACAA